MTATRRTAPTIPTTVSVATMCCSPGWSGLGAGGRGRGLAQLFDARSVEGVDEARQGELVARVLPAGHLLPAPAELEDVRLLARGGAVVGLHEGDAHGPGAGGLEAVLGDQAREDL